jgi:phosphoserine phosphatase
VLLDDGAALTGAVQEPILGRKAKLEAMRAEARRWDQRQDALAIGDGANDLDMIKAAGLGIAYRAKPLVAAEADAKIDYMSFGSRALLPRLSPRGLRRFQGHFRSRWHVDRFRSPGARGASMRRRRWVTR